MSLHDELTSADALQRETLSHEGLPDVEIRELRAKDMVELAEVEDDDARSVLVETVKRCVYDPETGERVFGDGDDEVIEDIPITWLQKVYEAADRVSDLEGFEVEGAAGN